jgi:ribosomal protein S19E (S16A)
MRSSGLGVNTLRTIYGSNQRNGTVSSHHHKADGAVIRYILKTLSKMGFLDLIVDQVEDETGKKEVVASKGKRISKKGRAEMDKIAHQIYTKLHPRK